MKPILSVPEPEIVDEPWTFRAACVVKDLHVDGRFITFRLFLDLGFQIYTEINCLLDGVAIVDGRQEQIAIFVKSWAANGQPNPLHVRTIRDCFDGALVWIVRVERTMLDGETLQAVGRESLAAALVEQGLCRA